MATLTPSALMVALVQTASTAPALLFGLAAGALADIVDRRRIILSTHVMLVVVAVVLGVAELVGYIGPAALLAGTFAIGAAFAFYLPAQGASINDLVGRSELPRRSRWAPWRSTSRARSGPRSRARSRQRRARAAH